MFSVFELHSRLAAQRYAHRAIGALLLAAIAAGSGGCKNMGALGDPNQNAGPSISTAQVVDSTPFGETNGKDEYNASGIVALADSRFLFCDNNISDALFEIALTAEGQKKGTLIRRPLQGLAAGSIDDMEDMAFVEENGKRYVFVTSSMSVKKAKKQKVEVAPSGLLRVSINADDSLSAENMPGIRAWLVSAYPQLAASAQKDPDAGGLNIEGLAWDKDRRALLFGVRTPLSGGKPIVLPVKVNDLAGAWQTGNLTALPAIAMSVEPATGEQGIRGLAAGSGENGFLVLIGNATSDSKAPFAVYTWDGAENGTARRLKVSFAKKTKPEGVTSGTIAGKGAHVFVDDGGGYRVIWDESGALR
jgi:hypothetical protein